MAQYKWKQIDPNLTEGGVKLIGSLTVSQSFGVTGSIFYNGELLEDYIAAQVVTGSNDWLTIANKPANIFSGSFIAGDNIQITADGQDITISTSADVIPGGTVSSSAQINFLEISNLPSGLVSSSAQILPIYTSSIINFETEVSRSVASFGFGTGDVNESEIQDSVVTASLAGSQLILTRRNLTSFALDLGDVVPDTPTGSFVYSGSFDLAPNILTLFRPDGNVQIDLSGIGGSINDGDITAVFAGSGLAGGGEGGDLVLSVNAAPGYGTQVINDYVAIATGSLYFTEGVIAAVFSASLDPVFTQTGSFFNTTNNIGITGSLVVSGSGTFTDGVEVEGDVNVTNNVSSSDSYIKDWGSVSASLASNLSYSTDTSASLAADLTAASSSINTRIDNVSSSLAAETAQLLEFSSSLDDTFATDEELNAVSASLKVYVTDADTALSASLAVDIATNKDDLSVASSSLALRITAQEEFSSSLDDTFATDAELAAVSNSLEDRITEVSSSFVAGYLKNTTDTLVGDLTVTGTVTAQEFHSEFVSASIIYESGSTKFGDTADDLHSFTGSLKVTSGDNTLSSISINGDGNSFLRIQDSGSRFSLLQRRSDLTEGQLRILQNGATKFIFTDGGYLGVNSATVPSKALVVTGEIQSTSGSYFATSGGSVGIGITTPSEKLQVVGNISSSDAYINQWGSVSGSLAEISASAANAYTLTLQDVTDNGNLTTNHISISSSLNVSQSIVARGEDVLDFAVAMSIALG